MKSTIKCLLLLMLVFLSPGCVTAPQEMALALIIDRTDPLLARPGADEITAYLGLKENPWQGVKVTITYISDKDVNDTQTISLESESRWTGNATIREAKVSQFIKALKKVLAYTKDTISLDHSIIYRTMAKELNTLSANKANSKAIMIYSDLMEHDDVDFYDTQTMELLKHNPDSIRVMLEKEAPLGDLSGLEVWLLYEPATYEANTSYRTTAQFYEHILESKGAKVHVGKTLNP